MPTDAFGRSRSFKLSVVVPCYNEAEVVGRFHSALSESLQGIMGCEPEIIFVDDGSTDHTADILEDLSCVDPAVHVLSLSRNFGHQIAITAGLDSADGDAVIIMDADLQHPPELIPEMVASWKHGADIVSAIRQSTRGVSWAKEATSRLFYRAINMLSDTYIVPGAADFCLLSRRAHHALLSVRERQRFLRGLVSWIGFNRTFLPFDAPPRFAGKSSYTPIKMLRLAMAAVLSFSTRPLRWASRLGLLTSAAGGAYLVYVLFARLVLNSTVEGWSSLASIVLILGGVQLLFLGLLGEYLGVVYEEAKQRPLYLLKCPTRRPKLDEETLTKTDARRVDTVNSPR